MSHCCRSEEAGEASRKWDRCKASGVQQAGHKYRYETCHHRGGSSLGRGTSIRKHGIRDWDTAHQGILLLSSLICLQANGYIDQIQLT